jgi:hypothetical protein
MKRLIEADALVSGSRRARNSSRRFFASLLALSMGAASCLCSSLLSAKSISYVGVAYDQTNFGSGALDIGRAGYWFPQFAAAGPVAGRPTDENDRDSLPSWAGPLNHATSPLDPGFSTRTFSQDNGGVRSKGGDPSWNTFTLPDGETGLSGAIVDPQTVNNSNNTINRIFLNSGAAGDALPSSFLVHIVTDNTGGGHDPVNRLRPRGEGPTQADVSVQLGAADLSFNGTADVYTFRYDGWAAGDWIKLQLNGGAGGASIAGVLFDVVPEPTSAGLAIAAGLCAAAAARRSSKSRL